MSSNLIRRLIPLIIVLVSAAVTTLLFTRPAGNSVGVSYNNSGTAHFKKGEYALAITDYNKAIAQNPKDSVAYYNRGATLLAQEEYDGAISDFDQAIGINPQYAVAFGGRGVAYYKKEQYDLAISDFTCELKYGPQHSATYAIRGLCYKKIAQYDHAIADFNAAISLDSKNVEAYFNKAIACELADKKSDAVDAYQKVIAYAGASDQNLIDTAKTKLKELGE